MHVSSLGLKLQVLGNHSLKTEKCLKKHQTMGKIFEEKGRNETKIAKNNKSRRKTLFL